MDKITVVRGNSFNLAVSLSTGRENPVPYDLSDASDIALRLVGTTVATELRNLRVRGNVILGLVGGGLPTGSYGIEAVWIRRGLARRAAECGLIEIVECNAQTTPITETEGESGYGIDIRIISDIEYVWLGGDPSSGAGHHRG